jgi:hypothetical protein
VYEEAFDTVVKETLIEVAEPDVAVSVGADGFESWVGAVGVGRVNATSLKVEVSPFVVSATS